MILAESTKVGLKVQLSGEEMRPLVVISKTYNESKRLLFCWKADPFVIDISDEIRLIGLTLSS